MKARVVHTKFWDDDYVGSLSAKEKVLFLYYLTNSSVNICGMYEIAARRIAFNTGLTEKEIQQFNEKFQDDGKFLFSGSWIKVVNIAKYQQFRGSRNDVAKQKEIDDIPPSILKDFNRLSEKEDRLSEKNDSPSNKYSVISNKYKGGIRGVKILDNPDEVKKLVSKFPNIDVVSEIEKMKDWLAANGKKKKDYIAFARNWLRRNSESASPPKKEPIPF